MDQKISNIAFQRSKLEKFQNIDLSSPLEDLPSEDAILEELMDKLALQSEIENENENPDDRGDESDGEAEPLLPPVQVAASINKKKKRIMISFRF